MRALALLAALALAGCTGSPEPVLSDPGAPQPTSPAPTAPPPAAPPPSAAPPASNATGAGPGSDAWDGSFTQAHGTGINDGPHDLIFSGSVRLNVTITLTGMASQGGVAALLERSPGDCAGDAGTSQEVVLRADGPSPLTLSGIVPAGAYCFWVNGAPGGVHVMAAYRADASWVPAPGQA